MVKKILEYVLTVFAFIIFLSFCSNIFINAILEPYNIIITYKQSFTIFLVIYSIIFFNNVLKELK